MFLTQATTTVAAMKFNPHQGQRSMDLYDDTLVCRGILHLTRDRVFVELGRLTTLNPDLITSIRSSLVRLLLGITATGTVNNPDNTSPSAPSSDHALEMLESLLRSPMSKDWKSAFTTAVELLVSPSCLNHLHVLMSPQASSTRKLGACSASHRCRYPAAHIRRRKVLCGYSDTPDQSGLSRVPDN
jgi:hypothetical protein